MDPMAAASGAAPVDEVGGERSIAATFFTNHAYPQEQMPTTAFTIPSTTLLEGLNALVNDVLFADESAKPSQAIPFDFIINDEYLPNRTSLDTFLRRQRRRLGLPQDQHEEILHIEYVPAFQAQEGAKLPHDDWIASVRAPIPGNAEFLVTGAYDHAVRVWSGESCVAVGTGHVEAVKAVMFVPGTVKLHEGAIAPTDGSARRRRRGRDAGDAQQRASFDMVSASKDGTIRAWRFDANTDKIEPLVSTASALGATMHTDSVDAIDVSTDGSLVATGSWDCTSCIMRYDDLIGGDTVKPLYTFNDHARAVLKVRFSAQNASTLYTTGLDGSIKIWDVEKGMMLGTMNGGGHAAQGLSVRPAGATSASSAELVLAGHTDNRVRLYDPRVTGKDGKSVLKVWVGHRQWVYGVEWLWRQEEEAGASSSTTLMASTSEDATMRIWDLRSTATPLLTLDSLHTDGILDVTYAGSMKLATGGKDNRTKSVTVEQP
jgi:ribosome biogenesis protein YTM1